jgi:peptidoglycan hydrolase-like protein with peptidoglycan-binding domain
VGDDVTQLQEALIRIGLLTGPPTGTFDQPTEDAVSALYEAHGSTAPGPTPEDAAGVHLPAAEIVYVSELPAVVEHLGVALGDEMGGEDPLATLATGGLVVRTAFVESDRQRLEVGDAVRVDDEQGQLELHGAIDAIAEHAEPDEAGALVFVARISLDGPVDDGVSGSSVRVTVDAVSTDEEVLVVPISALVSSSDTRTSVVVVGEGGQRRVQVRGGLSADGFVEVTPVDGDLREGDEVVVGR